MDDIDYEYIEWVQSLTDEQFEIVVEYWQILEEEYDREWMK